MHRKWVLTTLEGLVGSQKKLQQAPRGLISFDPNLYCTETALHHLLHYDLEADSAVQHRRSCFVSHLLMSGSNSYSASIASMGFFQTEESFGRSLLQHRRFLRVFPFPEDQWPPCHKKLLRFFGSSPCGTTYFYSEFDFSNRGGAQGAGNGVCGSCTPPIVYRCASDLCSPLSDRFGGTWTGCFKSMDGLGRVLHWVLSVLLLQVWLMSLISGRRRRGLVTRDGLYVILLYE